MMSFSLQAGQADVDGGGWTYAVDEPTSLRLEFSSSGKVSAPATQLTLQPLRSLSTLGNSNQSDIVPSLLLLLLPGQVC